MSLIEYTKSGIYCPIADVYIDPTRRVRKALITHGHSDHARSGHESYLCTKESVPILKHRLGSHIKTQGLSFQESVNINGVNISFHPAGHVIGSAQVKLEYKGEIWVISGDYKIQNDNISGVFSPVKCHSFISECTFGLPIFKWQSQHTVMNDINSWWAYNARHGITSIIYGYSLGKTQRILANINAEIGPIFEHGAIKNTHDMFRSLGYDLPEANHVDKEHRRDVFEKALVFAPPSAGTNTLLRKFNQHSEAFASGWMLMKNRRKSFQADSAFVMSDHADWPGLISAIKGTEAENIYLTHGYTEPLQSYLVNLGLNAKVLGN